MASQRSRRLERLGNVGRAIAYVVGGWALILWYFPIVIFVPMGILALRSGGSTGMGGDELWTWLGQPVGLLPLLVGTVLAVALTATAAMARRRSEAPTPTRRP